MQNERILITGAAGMLAQAFKALVLPTSADVTLADRATLDLGDGASIDRVMDGVRPTLVLNCAAYTKVDLAEKERDKANAVNGTGVGQLAKACKRHQARLVHFSTDYVFDGTLRRPLQPDDPTGPKSAYGESKLLGEKLLAEINPPGWLNLRTAWLYGPGGPCFPATMVKLATDKKPLRIVADQQGTPTFTHDLAAATFELLRAGATGTWHVTNRGDTNWHDFTAAILDEFGLQTDLSKTTSAEWKKLKPDSAERPAYSVLDLTPFEKLTGHAMPDWRDALRRYRAALG